jgi:hypothetical protein
MTQRLATHLACGTLLVTAACLKAEVASPQVRRIGEHLRFEGDAARLRTHSDGHHAFVSVHVGDKGPFNFIVDTGSLQFRGMPGGSVLTVVRVDAGSLGERAGIKAGDTFIALNGRPAGEYDMAALGTLFRSATPLRFELERGGAPHIIEIR